MKLQLHLNFKQTAQSPAEIHSDVLKAFNMTYKDLNIHKHQWADS